MMRGTHARSMSVVFAAILLMAHAGAEAPRVTVSPAPWLEFPGAPPRNLCDANNPAHWSGEGTSATLYLFNSWGHPARSQGRDVDHLSSPTQPVKFNNEVEGGRWLECTWQPPGAPRGELYGWYHWEPRGVCPDARTAPKIGALRSHDDGASWQDLGVVLAATSDSLRCDTPNDYFAGGHGDFSAIDDRAHEFVYLFFSQYSGPAAGQGVAVARIAARDVDDPVGKVWKWRDGQWRSPGLEGETTPIFPVARDWHDPKPDAFWGPSVHYNTHLRQYVMLLNRAVDNVWKQDGIYISFNPDVADPAGWSTPARLPIELEGPIHLQFYPQVIGLDAAARETDKLAGRRARLFVAGRSRWFLEFVSPPW